MLSVVSDLWHEWLKFSVQNPWLKRAITSVFDFLLNVNGYHNDDYYGEKSPFRAADSSVKFDASRYSE